MAIRSGGRQSRRLVATTGAVGLVLLATAGPAGAAPRVPKTPVGLTITLTDGMQQARPHSAVRYTARLDNRGPEPVKLRLVLSVPSYATLGSAPGASLSPGSAAWTVSAPAGGAAVRSATARIGSIPASLLHVTVLASAYRAKAAATALPLVRTADSDSIPGIAGGTANAPARQQASRHDDAGLGGWALAGIALGSLALVAGMGLAGLAVLRRHRRPPPPAEMRDGLSDHQPANAGPASGSGSG